MKKLSVSQEDYLEEIYKQVLNCGFAKVTVISDELKVKKASVTNALNQLSVKKLIHYTPYSSITLTKEGELLAKEILKKHKWMMTFFIDILKLDPKEAEENACKMEHIMSEKLFKKTIKLAEYLKEYATKHPEFDLEIKTLLK